MARQPTVPAKYLDLIRSIRMSDTRKAVVLLSGGLDSATVLAIAREQGFQVAALSFRYGQRHEHELVCAERLCRQAGISQHVILDIDLRKFGGSALTSNMPVPKHSDVCEIGDKIPVTYVPARNTVFLSFALAWSEVLRASDLFIGVNALDYSGYPDCRPDYIAAFQRMANLATKGAVEGDLPIRIQTPLIDLTKAQIIRRGLELGVNYGLTTSCYDPTTDGLACGGCDACLLRLKGFEEHGLMDPARYATKKT